MTDFFHSVVKTQSPGTHTNDEFSEGAKTIRSKNSSSALNALFLLKADDSLILAVRSQRLGDQSVNKANTRGKKQVTRQL